MLTWQFASSRACAAAPLLAKIGAALSSSCRSGIAHSTAHCQLTLLPELAPVPQRAASSLLAMPKAEVGDRPPLLLKGWQLSAEAPSETGLHSSAFLVQKALSRSALDARKQLEANLALAQSHALSAWETRVQGQGLMQGLQELAQRLPAMTIPGASPLGGALRIVDDPLSRSLRSFRASSGKELAERGDKGDRRAADAFRFNQTIGSGEWDILKSLDKNLRTLEKAFMEGAAEHEKRVRAAARKRAKLARDDYLVSGPHRSPAPPLWFWFFLWCNFFLPSEPARASLAVPGRRHGDGAAQATVRALRWTARRRAEPEDGLHELSPPRREAPPRGPGRVDYC